MQDSKPTLAVVWTNMKRFFQPFLFCMGLVLMLGVQGGIETAEDWIDWFWILAVFVGAMATMILSIRIDKVTE